MGKALYRKYRPISLDSVVGQDEIIKPLSEAIKSGNFSHAYIFTGPRGCGKTSVARIFAHEINGFKYELEDSYVDIIEIDGASNTSVDNVRDLREKALIAPSEGKYKVYIIDEFHMLSKSAFNALLKIMEEPPKHVIFVLATTDLEKVPVTITSRAQVFCFKLADHDTMKKHLKAIAKSEKIDITDDALDIIVRRGGGSFRDTISLLDQISTLKPKDETITAEDINSALGLPNSEKINKILESFERNDVKNTTLLLKDLLNSGATAETIAKDIIEQIIEKPNAKTLNLVSKLFNVSYPFAEAKLLVAFLEAEKLPAASVTPIVETTEAPAAPAKPAVKNSAREALMKRIERSKVEEKNRSEQAKEEKPAEMMAASLTDSVIQSGVLNLEAYVRDIKDLNNMLGSALEKASFILGEKELKIYPETKSFVNILNSKNNLNVLREAAPGYHIIVVNIEEEPAPKNAKKYNGEKVKTPEISEKMQKKIDGISDIMGAGIKLEETDNPF
jgi:DNA polymerase-3 subunit gamma/tau